MATSHSDMDERVQERLQSDPHFREALKTEPRAAIEQALGIHLPPAMMVEVVENTPDKHYIVLPQQTNGQELSDDDLDEAAGGLLLTDPIVDPKYP